MFHYKNSGMWNKENNYTKSQSNKHSGKLENSSFKSHIVLSMVQVSTQQFGIQPLNLSYVKK